MSLIDILTSLAQREAKFGAGQPLFHRDDPVAALFIIRSGLVHLLRHSPAGDPVVLQRAGEGSVLAEASIFSSNYHCDARAITPTRVGRIAMADIRLALDRPEAAKALAKHLAREVQRMRMRTEILSLRSVAQRLDAWLALADGAMPPKGQWRSVAADIGVSAEAFYRELARRR